MRYHDIEPNHAALLKALHTMTDLEGVRCGAVRVRLYVSQTTVRWVVSQGHVSRRFVFDKRQKRYDPLNDDYGLRFREVFEDMAGYAWSLIGEARAA